MSARFTVLASGSSGNAALLQTGGFGLLIDCGLNPRVLTTRLHAVGCRWQDVSAVVLTHTHGDHWNGATLLHLDRQRLPVYVHARHDAHLSANSLDYPTLQKSGLVRTYADGHPVAFADGLRGLPVRVPHDSDPTFAFRLDGEDRETGRWWSLGYASDLGHAPDALVEVFQGLDALAVEYNHDERMERNSGRPWHLINRVLGPNGHLSNRQAAEFTREVAAGSALRAVVQLHLSRHCNEPRLAVHAGRWAINEAAARAILLTATQDRPTQTIELVGTRDADLACVSTPAHLRTTYQPTLPGMS
jgi:phosphoribosyl 1,2-cyclic phosphodiesterase